MILTAVVGASGYSGAELVGLLARHPEVRLVSLHAESSAGQDFADLHPRLRHLHSGPLEPFDPARLAGLDLVFLALPHGASARAAAQLVGKVGRIIDLSGDLRLDDPAVYREWYGAEHPAPELLGTAVYGLPELNRAALKGAPLIACAGCYATVVQLAAAPALAAGAGPGLVAAAMSGTTGAGRKADLALSFSEAGQNLRAYRVGRHQHVPEIAAGLAAATGVTPKVTFVPHLVPLTRGILASVVLDNRSGLEPAALLAAYRHHYRDCRFVRVADPARRLPEVADVVGTNFCDLAPAVDAAAGTLVIVGVLDNLIKGAAGQAVQVMNLSFGLAEDAGLFAGMAPSRLED